MTQMHVDRRTFLTGALGAGTLVGTMAAPGRAAEPFTSRRIVVTVRGTGRDVLLIPGLASGPAIWNRAVAAVPGCRWHMVHVRGFAGLEPQANASGPLVQPIADEIARYVEASRIGRPAIVGHSMGGTLAMMLGMRGIGAGLMVIDMLPAGAAMLGGTAAGMGFLADQIGGYLTGTVAGRRYLAQIVAQAPGAQGSDPEVIANALRDLANIDLGPQLPRIGPPMEVVYAVGADREQGAAIASRFRAAYAGKTGVLLTPIGPSGHMVMGDQPDRFNAELAKFLKRI